MTSRLVFFALLLSARGLCLQGPHVTDDAVVSRRKVVKYYRNAVLRRGKVVSYLRKDPIGHKISFETQGKPSAAGYFESKARFCFG